MEQHGLGLGMTGKRTRLGEFLGEMKRVVPWSDLVALVCPDLPEDKRRRQPSVPGAMLRIHFVQQWFNLSDQAMEDAAHEVPLFFEFAGLEGWGDRLQGAPAFASRQPILSQLLKTETAERDAC